MIPKHLTLKERMKTCSVQGTGLLRYVVVVACCVEVFSQTTWAGGIVLYEIGTPDVGHAAAGRAALGQDASTAFTNPAAMTRLDQSQLLVGLQPLYINLRFDPGPNNTNTGGNGGNAGGFSPAMGVYYVHSISPDLKVGFSTFSYFGLAADFDDNWVGRYFAQELALVTVGVSPSIGYQVNDWLSVGAGPTVLFGKLKQEAAVNNVLDAIPDGKIKLEETDFGFGGNVGVMIEPSKGTRFGVQYLTPVKLDFEDAAELQGLGPLLRGALNASGLVGSKVDFGITIPQMVMVSGYHELTDSVAIMGNVGWQDWSEFGQQEVTVRSSTTTSLTTDLNYQDTWHVAIGTQYRLDDRWLLSTGFAYDSSAVSDEDRTITFAVDRQIRVSGGAQYQWDDDLILGAAYTYFNGGDAEIDQTRGPLAGRLQGDFSSNEIHFLNFTIRKLF